MLDIMRKHASSWGIKAILGMIILSFVLFFGYSRISKVRQPSIRGDSDQTAVAFVNSMAVPESEYRFYYDTALDRVRSKSEGKPVPDFMRDMLQQTTLSQLVQRELILQVADNIGLSVTDEQLAEAIKQSQIALRGSFDSTFYRNQYLPYFQNRFGINFEDMLRNDLRAEETQALFATPTSPVKKEDSEQKTEKAFSWSFEVVILDVDKMIDEKITSSREDAEKIATEFIDNKSRDQWKKLAKKYDAKLEEINAVSLQERRSKLKGLSFGDYEAVFSLTEENDIVNKPIASEDNKIFIVRLLGREEVEEKADLPTGDNFFQKWMAAFAKKSKIRTFLDNQPQK